MSTLQKTLFDEVAETDAVAETGGVIFPCPVARSIPVCDERRMHIKSCDECQRLIKELDVVAYGTG